MRQVYGLAILYFCGLQFRAAAEILAEGILQYSEKKDSSWSKRWARWVVGEDK